MFNFVTKNFNLFVKFVYNFTSKICHKNLLTNSFQGNFQRLKELDAEFCRRNVELEKLKNTDLLFGEA